MNTWYEYVTVLLKKQLFQFVWSCLDGQWLNQSCALAAPAACSFPTFGSLRIARRIAPLDRSPLCVDVVHAIAMWQHGNSVDLLLRWCRAELVHHLPFAQRVVLKLVIVPSQTRTHRCITGPILGFRCFRTSSSDWCYWLVWIFAMRLHWASGSPFSYGYHFQL